MYTVAKAPNGVLAKTRFLGVNNNKFVSVDSNGKSISPPNERINGIAASEKTTSIEQVTNTGPRPVFNSPKHAINRRKHLRSTETATVVVPDAEVVSFFNHTWTRLQSSLDNPKSQEEQVVHYKPQKSQNHDFTPFNYERMWADHHYQKLIRCVDLHIQNQ